jgi:hypothetical protein
MMLIVRRISCLYFHPRFADRDDSEQILILRSGFFNYDAV